MEKHSELIKRTIIIFLVGFFLNAVWEVLHSTLYVHYKGGPITSLVLLQATFVDGLILAGLFFTAHVSRVRPQYFLFAGGVVIALGIEWWALGTSRWAYAQAMPLVPLVQTGLSPTVQLACTGLVALLVAKRL